MLSRQTRPISDAETKSKQVVILCTIVLLVKQVVVKLLKSLHSPCSAGTQTAQGRVGVQQEHYRKVPGGRINSLDVRTAKGGENCNHNNTGSLGRCSLIKQ